MSWHEISSFGLTLIYLTLCLGGLVTIAGIVYVIMYHVGGGKKGGKNACHRYGKKLGKLDGLHLGGVSLGGGVSDSRVNHFRRQEPPPTPERKIQVHPYIVMNTGKSSKSSLNN